MADTSVAITPGAGANVDAQSVPGGDLQQTVTLGDGQNAARGAQIRPDAELRVAMDPSGLLEDTFESLDTVSTWTTGGTVVPTVALGTLTVSAGTAASAQSYLRSQSTFINGASAYPAPFFPSLF